MKENKKEILLVAGILLLSVVAFATSGREREIIEGGRLEISRDEDTYLNIDIESDDYQIEGYELMVNKPSISLEEFERLVEENRNAFIEKMLGENQDTEKIEKSLVFFSKYEDLPFEFMWFVNDKIYISDSGEIMCAEEFDTVVEIYISYKSYTVDLSIPIHVEPCEEEIQRINKSKFESQLNNVINSKVDAMMNTEDQSYIDLPQDVNGNKVSYYLSGESKRYIYLLLGPVGVLAIHLAFLRDKHKKELEEMEDVMEEYPSVLQKISLYVSSGMTIRNVWSKICADVTGQGNEKHPLYREMIVTLNELNNGVPESMAYIRFGERIRKSEIVRFTALLSQNLKRGSTRLSELLDNEVRNAFVDKKNRAKKRGEEIGTRLLVPMIILLTDTIVMIMVPAFWSI